MITIVTPAFNEAENLPVVYERIRDVLTKMNVPWEWIVVDDHSTDKTPEILERLAEKDDHVRVFRLSRNFGAHTALLCGLSQVRGDRAVVMAGDGKESPSLVPRLNAEWEKGSHVVWGVRSSRKDESALTRSLSKLYYLLLKRLLRFPDLPPSGTDCFLLDRIVISSLRHFHEGNANILVLIAWMGFNQKFVEYERNVRLSGKSKWTVEKKVKLLIDSITSFSYLPIRFISYVGFLTSFVGFIYASLVVKSAITSGNAPQGWPALMVALLVIGGVIMIMMGILGEYVWRALDESRRRPLYLVEKVIEQKPRLKVADS